MGRRESPQPHFLAIPLKGGIEGLGRERGGREGIGGCCLQLLGGHRPCFVPLNVVRIGLLDIV